MALVTPWTQGHQHHCHTEFPPAFCLPTLSPILSTSFCQNLCPWSCVFPSHCTEDAGVCWVFPTGYSELGEGSVEPNIHLQHSCLLLLTPMNCGCPKFPLFPLLFLSDLDKLAVGPSLVWHWLLAQGHHQQGLWQTQQRVAPHPPGDKKVNPKPSRDVQG